MSDIRYMTLTWIKFARHYSILFALTKKQNRGFGIKFKSQSEKFDTKCFATDRVQAILVRARSTMKQKERRTATTQLAPTDTFRVARLFRILFSLHARVYDTARLASLTRNDKWKAWHSFSLTKATGTLALYLFFSPPRTSRPGGSWRMRASITDVTIIRFYRFKRTQKRVTVLFTQILSASNFFFFNIELFSSC